MIAGAVNQPGFKEDQLAQKFLPQNLPGFADILKTSTGKREQAVSPGKAIKQVLPDPRLRNTFLREPGEDKPEPREDIAGLDRASQHALTKASPAATPIHKAPDPTPPPPTEEAEAPDVPSKALVRRDGGTEEPRSEVGRPGSVAATGLAAYKLSPHGQGEELFAELAGTLPLGEKLGDAKSLGEQTDKLDNSVLFAKPPVELPEEAKGDKPQTALDVLNLARKAATPNPQLEETFLTEAELETAQGRNDLLARLGQPLNGSMPPDMAAALARGMGQGGKGDAKPKQAPTTASTALKNAAPSAPIPGLTLPATGAAASQQLAQQPADVHRARVMERIAEQARWVIRNNRNEVTFKLSPEHLGDVRLKVTQTEGMLKVDMMVESLAVKRMVESQLDDLRLRLQDENLTSDEFSFNVDVRQGDDSKESQAFALRPQTASVEREGSLAEAANPNHTVDRQRPVWGHAGSGIYA